MGRHILWLGLVVLASAVIGLASAGSDEPAVTAAVVSNNDPSVKGTYAWWSEKMQNDQKEFDDTDNKCTCDCLVINPTDPLPFDCKCDCKKPVQGPQGEQGAKGAKGKVGEVGGAGRRGTIGPQGKPGIPGTRGDKGQKGLKGEHGRGGDDGIDGRALPGLQGEKGLPGKAKRGPQGPKGPNGPQGPRGDEGVPGKPQPGPEGAKGYQGRQGDKGAKGQKGEQGPRGPDGPRGPMGPPGVVEPVWKSKSLFANSLGESACLSLTKNPGWITGISRDCSERKTCTEICAEVKSTDKVDQANDGAKFQCFGAIKLDGATPTQMYSFAACDNTSCGPNFCCCIKEHNAE